MRSGRETRNREIILKLSAAGFDVSYEELLQEAGGESIGRPHIAALLLRKGYFKTMQDAFDQYLKRGCRCYVARALPEPAEAIRAIHAAGGLAIWAHPVSGQSGERAFAGKCCGTRARRTRRSRSPILHVFRTSDRVDDRTGRCRGHPQIRRGSDFHGTNQPIRISICGCGSLAVPFDYLEAMRDRLAERKGMSL